MLRALPLLLLVSCGVEWGPRPPPVTACEVQADCSDFDCTVWEVSDPTCNWESTCTLLNEEIGACECEPGSCR